MTTDPQLIAFLDQENAHTAQVVREHRYTFVHVARDDPDDADFTYTVGLFGLGHPELVVVGVGQVAGQNMLDAVARLVVAGRDLLPGEHLSWPRRPGGLVVEYLPNPGEVLFRANDFYGRPDEFSVPGYQLAWPHPDGSFPWDDDYACGPECQPRPGTWHA